MNRHGGREREQVIEAVLRQGAVALERVAFAREAEAARAAAEEEKLRSALLSSISHDLRTPLATILGSVTTLRELGEAMPAEARADLLAAIEEETDRLSRFVANLLAMTRLEAGVAVKRDWTDAADVLRAALTRARMAFPHQAGRACRWGRLAIPLVRADATLLEQAVFNLIDNAARHSPAGEPVRGLSAPVEGRSRRDCGRGSRPGRRLPRCASACSTSSSPPRRRAWGSASPSAAASSRRSAATIALEAPEAPQGGARFVIRLKVERAPQEA